MPDVDVTKLSPLELRKLAKQAIIANNGSAAQLFVDRLLELMPHDNLHLRMSAAVAALRREHATAADLYKKLGDRPRTVHQYLLAKKYKEAFVEATPGRTRSADWTAAVWVWMIHVTPEKYWPAGTQAQTANTRDNNDASNLLAKAYCSGAGHPFATMLDCIRYETLQDKESMGNKLGPGETERLLALTPPADDPKLILDFINTLQQGKELMDRRWFAVPLLGGTPKPDTLEDVE